ncbi:alkene reductase [Bradyrhizobium uaiense]|uniref:Alkene reductase n=1 Tax=Bradyrhizobium uaiense TaxID=2594946 RepID=A0A6P1BKY9_9BRAD|nr:alkene reductase [Bradyrhizobium uaiense]NEU98290.1 alkene reductase [Bradyrhizobium uaiense]
MPNSLHDPLAIGDLRLSHRVVMAPLTRMRAGPGGVPTALNQTYYAQRSSVGGFLISEATQISAVGKGFPDTPGIHDRAQVRAWRDVTDAVHAGGGFIFLQLWHVGRISHSLHQPFGQAPVAPSAIRPAGNALGPDFRPLPFETPRALQLHEIWDVVDDYRRAARNAVAAGFDGVEVHGANGYLLDQFLQDRTNCREDGYGDSVENRARLLLEVTDAVIGVWGRERVGVRLSPFGAYGDIADSNPEAIFGHVVQQLSRRGIGYLHLIEPRASLVTRSDALAADAPSASALFRRQFVGPCIVAGGFSETAANRVIAAGEADAVAFGRFFVANPDLPQRLKLGAALQPYDRSTFYGGGAKGYTDYAPLSGELVHV